MLCAPGNAGIARDGVECLPDGDVVAVAQEREVDLVVVGPEAPLVAGLVDELTAAGIPAFGPTRAAARIEGSKAYAKELMRDCGVPTASHVMFRDREEAAAHLACASYPAVLKADVLAAGKGVIIAKDEREARAALDVFFGEKRFGETEVVLEEFLEGEELSLLALCDGERAVPLAPAQDYKRIFDGDEGPNTGGMGSYSPVPGDRRERAREIAAQVHQPIVDELRRRGTPFHGVLYAGLMMAPDGGAEGARVQRPLRRPRDAGGAAAAALRPARAARGVHAPGRAGGHRARVVERLGGDRGARLARLPGVVVERRRDLGPRRRGRAPRCSTRARAERDGDVVTAGGRVLNVTGLGATPGEARDRAYAAAEGIEFDGRQMRTDIAARAVDRVEA